MKSVLSLQRGKGAGFLPSRPLTTKCPRPNLRSHRGRAKAVASIQSNDSQSVEGVANDNRTKVALLSLDGGGIRGLIQTYVLEELESVIRDIHQERGETVAEVHLADYFECISGTSVGSIIGLFLAGKLGTAKDARKLIVDRHKDIFSVRPPWYKPWEHLARVGGYFMPKYTASGIDETLMDIFGDKKLSDLHTSVLVPAFEIDGSGLFLFWAHRPASEGTPVTGYSTLDRKPIVYDSQTGSLSLEEDKDPEERKTLSYLSLSSAFTTYGDRRSLHDETRNVPKDIIAGGSGSTQRVMYEPILCNYKDTDFYLRTVARASSAAPTFFPAATVTAVKSGEHQSPVGKKLDFSTRSMIDGGMVSNNPTLHALSFMVEFDKNYKAENVAVLSLGAGNAVPDASDAITKGGVLSWLGDMISVLMGSAGEALDEVIDRYYYIVFNAELGQYLRIQQVVSPHAKKDGSGNAHVQADPKLTVDNMLDALSSLDRTNRVDVLEAMGMRLAKAFRSSLRTFAERYLVPPAP